MGSKREIAVAVLVCLGLWSGATEAAQVTVFSEDFESGSADPAFGGAGSVEGTQDYSGKGDATGTFASHFLRNTSDGDPASATSLQLTGLQAHTSIDLDFFLGLIDSWAAQTGVDHGGDTFNVAVDGDVIFSERMNGRDLSNWSYTPPAGVALTVDEALGFTEIYNDGAFNMGLDTARFDDIPHTGETLTVEWFASGAGWQGGDDESWAIDNVQVTLNGTSAIPTPSAVAMGMLCLGLLGARQRRGRPAQR